MGLVLGSQHALALSPWQQHRRDSVKKHKAAPGLASLSAAAALQVRVKETLGEAQAAMECRDGGWSPPAPVLWGGFRPGQ